MANANKFEIDGVVYDIEDSEARKSIGDFNVAQILKSGVEIAKINGVTLFAPQGGSGGTSDYSELSNKPSINNIELNGNKTLEALGIMPKTNLSSVATSGSYNDLEDKPSIPTVSANQLLSSGTHIADITINGNKTEIYAPQGGSGGTTNYSELSNKPKINNVELSGNKTLADLGISNYDDTALTNRVSALETLVGQANEVFNSLFD